MEVTADNVTINVSGRRFEMTAGTYKVLMNKLPLESTTKLDPSGKELFFERHPDAFQNILHYFQTGYLHLPLSVCPKLFKAELDFWGVDITALDKCCYNDYGTFDGDQKSLEKYEKYSERKPLPIASNSCDRYRFKLWEILNYPFASTVAQVYFWFSMAFVLLGIAILCAWTHPDLMDQTKWSSLPAWLQSYLIRHYGPNVYNVTTGELVGHHAKFSQLFLVEMACNVFVTVEVILKLATCPLWKNFFCNVINVTDVLSMLPLYLWLCLDAAKPSGQYIMWAEKLLEIAAILRVFRLLRLARRVDGLRVILFALFSSASDFMLLMLMLCIATVVYSSIMFYIDTFPSIPDGFWWAIITMTTVGYGDMVPVTGAGKVVGCLCAMTGVLIIALTVPIFVNRFLLYYTYVGKPKHKRHDSDYLGILNVTSGPSTTTLHNGGKSRQRPSAWRDLAAAVRNRPMVLGYKDSMA